MYQQFERLEFNIGFEVPLSFHSLRVSSHFLYLAQAKRDVCRSFTISPIFHFARLSFGRAKFCRGDVRSGTRRPGPEIRTGARQFRSVRRLDETRAKRAFRRDFVRAPGRGAGFGGAIPNRRPVGNPRGAADFDASVAPTKCGRNATFAAISKRASRRDFVRAPKAAAPVPGRDFESPSRRNPRRNPSVFAEISSRPRPVPRHHVGNSGGAS